MCLVSRENLQKCKKPCRSAKNGGVLWWCHKKNRNIPKGPPLQSSFSTTLAIPNLAWRCQTRVMMEPEGEEFLNSFGTLSKYQEVTNAFFEIITKINKGMDYYATCVEHWKLFLITFITLSTRSKMPKMAQVSL